jgi:hypothetical protein
MLRKFKLMGTRQAGSNTKPSNYFEILTSTWLSPFMAVEAI